MLARFRSPAGALMARLDDGWIALDFPALPPAPVDPPPELVRAPVDLHGLPWWLLVFSPTRS